MRNKQVSGVIEQWRYLKRDWYCNDNYFDMPALDRYADSVVRFGREEQVRFYLIPGRKTDAKLIKLISGIRFLTMQIAVLIILNTDNIIIIHFLGPEEVTL